MPRTSKCRRVCALPPNAVFTPQQTPCAFVVLTVEQVEALRPVSYTHLDVYKRQLRSLFERKYQLPEILDGVNVMVWRRGNGVRSLRNHACLSLIHI